MLKSNIGNRVTYPTPPGESTFGKHLLNVYKMPKERKKINRITKISFETNVFMCSSINIQRA